MDSPTTSQSPALITTCDGLRFKRLLAGALAWLEQNYKRVDQLNVFPVPDGDTGTNMLLTVRNAYKEILGHNSTEIGVIAVRFAHGALRGSRGNSGTILSEMMRGFANELSGCAAADGPQIAKAFRQAVRLAYAVIQQPTEGTILTVAREVADALEAAVVETNDLHEILYQAMLAAQRSVARTPDLLPILRKAGVVDSGAQGLSYLIEGMWLQAKGEKLTPTSDLSDNLANPSAPAGASGDPHGLPDKYDLQTTLRSSDPLGYGYDVQFILRGRNLDVDAVRAAVGAMGDSMVVAGDSSLIKVHIHVHDPGVPLSYGAARGVIEDVVVENMQAQSEAYIAARQSSEIRDVKVNPDEIAVVAIAPGEGLQRVFKGLGAAAVIDGGQSMNPTSGAIADAITALDTSQVIVLPNNKNIQLTTEQAVRSVADKQVRIIPTRTIPQGIAALLAFNAEGALDSVVETMTSARLSVISGEVTTATRSIQMDGVDVREGELIGLIDGKLTLSGSRMLKVVKDLLWRMNVTDHELVTLYYGATVTAEEADELVAALREVYPAQEFELFEGGQPYYFYILSAE